MHHLQFQYIPWHRAWPLYIYIYIIPRVVYCSTLSHAVTHLCPGWVALHEISHPRYHLVNGGWHNYDFIRVRLCQILNRLYFVFHTATDGFLKTQDADTVIDKTNHFLSKTWSHKPLWHENASSVPLLQLGCVYCDTERLPITSGHSTRNPSIQPQLFCYIHKL